MDWHAAKTIPQKERIAQINLERQGVTTLLPRFWKTYRRLKRFENRLRPVFPGYIFFQCPPDPALWRNIGGTLGVSYILWSSRRTPALVPSAFMESLAGSCVDGVFQAPEQNLKIGTQVQIVRGPFTGSLASVCTLDDRGRVSLLLNVMGGTIVHTNASDVESL